MAKTFALAAQTLLFTRLEPGRVFDERAQLCEPGVSSGSPLLELLVAAPCCGELAPRKA
jgi:hypothetical protein